MEQAIKKALLQKGTLYRDVPSPLLGQLDAIAIQHGLDAKGIASAFDKFMTTSRSQNTVAVMAEDLEAFAEHYSRPGRPQPLASMRSDNLFARGPSWEDATLGGILGAGAAVASGKQPSQRISPYLSKVPTRPASASKPRTPASTGKFKERLQGGELHSVLNPHVALSAEAGAVIGASFQPALQRVEVHGAQGCEVEVLGAPLRPEAKYMMNRVEDKVEHLERRITALEDALEAQGVEVHCVSRAAQDQAVFVGRICCDTEEGRLNQQSTLLEGSMRHSQGSRVRLDLSKCSAFRLFPGQVVVVKGVNPSGHVIVASEVIGGLPLPMLSSSLQQLSENANATGKRGVCVVIAAGPFTTSEDVEYEPLQALLAYCATRNPDVLLLLGPFVDAEHPAVRAGLLDETFDELFESRVLDQLAAFSSANSGVRVLLMPCVRDVHHHPVFPQPPLPPQPQLPLLSNLPSPATFRCNEVVFGCSSSDWLMACSSQEMSKTVGQTDRLPALASLVLSQHSYMPMFPPPPGLPLDSANSTALELPCTPDVLVLPSDLQPFAKLVPLPCRTLRGAAVAAGAEVGPCAMEARDTAVAAAWPQPEAGPSSEGNVVCINPGRLTKGTNGGTFAHVYIPAPKEVLDMLTGEPSATNAAVPHHVDQRCRVEIRRI